MKNKFEIILKCKNFKKKINPKIYVGILYSGEIQIENLLKSILESSSYAQISSINIYIIGYNNNLEAHKKLYKWFNKNHSQHRLKLDADMTIKNNTISKLISNKDNHRLIYPLYDYITKTVIYGVHYFPPFHNLNYESINKRFPDNLKDHYELKKEFIGIYHCKNATKDQILDFIIHRLVKLFESTIYMKVAYLKILLRAIIVNNKLVIKNLSYISSTLINVLLRKKNYKKFKNNYKLNKNNLEKIWNIYLSSNTSFQSE